MRNREIREQSLETARRLGVDVMTALPPLEPWLKMRSVDETAARMLGMLAVAAATYGFPRAKARDWLEREGMLDALTEGEARYIEHEVGDVVRFQLQVEGIWALAWAMSMVDELDFSKDCDDDFVAMLPNLKIAEPSTRFRRKLRARPPKEVIGACDLAYCLHWAVRESELSGKWRAGNLKPYVVIERRRALEWLLSTEDWDYVRMDT